MSLRYLPIVVLAIVAAAIGAFCILQNRSSDAEEYYKRGVAWGSDGEYVKAIADLTEAIRLDPKHSAAFYSRGIARGMKGETDKAIADYTEAIRLNPRLTVAFFNRGRAWNRKGETDKAIADYTEIIRIGPENADAFVSRGNAWDEKGEYDKEILDYTEAIRLDPTNPRLYSNRGSSWIEKGVYNNAIADYTEAIRIAPNPAFYCALRAWLLATCPTRQFRDGAAAVKDATRACELSDWKNSHPIRILGASYAEAGDFPQAIKWIKQAISMDDTERELRAIMLALFEAGKPFRDEDQ